MVGQSNQFYMTLVSLGTNIIAGIYGKGMFFSTNNGTNWTEINNGLANIDIYALASSGTNILAGTPDLGVFLSTNNGMIWTAVNNGISLYINAITISGTSIFAGGPSGVWLSTNGGSNWTLSLMYINPNIYSIAVSGTNIYAGGNGKVFISTNYGTIWITDSIVLTNQNILALANSGTNLFAGTEGGVFLSKNNGINWVIKNQGFTLIPTINSLSISNGYIFSGTLAHSVWLRSYSEITGIQKISELVPSSYFLSQNYPNPFNPITNIRYELLKSGLVNLVVFDVLGREIELLVNEKQNAGTYEITFNASQYSSGIYFYRLTTDNFSDTKKMLMIK